MNFRVISTGLRTIRVSPSGSLLARFARARTQRHFSSAHRLYADNVKRYTAQHEWIQIDDDKIGVVGITDYAQQLLGDVVFVELPPIDSFVERGDELGAVESVKSASDIYAPMSGQVFEVNENLTSKPSLINRSAEDDGWICKIAISEVEGELESLLTEEQYNEFLSTQHDEDTREQAEESSKKDH